MKSKWAEAMYMAQVDGSEKWVGKDLIVAQCVALSCHLPVGTDDNYDKP